MDARDHPHPTSWLKVVTGWKSYGPESRVRKDLEVGWVIEFGDQESKIKTKKMMVGWSFEIVK